MAGKRESSSKSKASTKAGSTRGGGPKGVEARPSGTAQRHAPATTAENIGNLLGRNREKGAGSRNAARRTDGEKERKDQ